MFGLENQVPSVILSGGKYLSKSACLCQATRSKLYGSGRSPVSIACSIVQLITNVLPLSEGRVRFAQNDKGHLALQAQHYAFAYMSQT